MYSDNYYNVKTNLKLISALSANVGEIYNYACNERGII